MTSQFTLTAEQEQTRQLARQVAAGFREDSLKWEQTGEFPWHNFKTLIENIGEDIHFLGAEELQERIARDIAMFEELVPVYQQVFE